MRNLFLTSALAVGLAIPAAAENWAVAIPDALPGGGEAVKTESWRFFLRALAPGDSYAILNATDPGLVAAIEVPDEAKYTHPKWRAKTFARENARIAEQLDQMAAGAPVTDVLGLLRHVALNRIEADRPLDLMILGSAVQVFEDTPDLSMRQGEILFVPSPEHLEAPIGESVYGMGAEGSDGLQNVYLHLCPVGDDLRADEAAALQGFYADYMAARGGGLVTWSDDLPTCFKRFGAELREPIEVTPYAKATGALTMVRVGEAVPKVVVETEPTTIIMEGIEVDQFNLFSSAPHPTLSGIEVTTGIVYTPGNFPDTYQRAYCYFNVSTSGFQLRFDLGEKRPGQAPIWEAASTAALTSGGISRAEFEAGHAACQWPAD